MSDKGKIFIQYWEKRRSMGKSKFILRIVLFMAVMLLAANTVGNLSRNEPIFKGLDQGKVLLMGLFFVGVVAPAIAWYTWTNNEKKYKEIKGEDE